MHQSRLSFSIIYQNQSSECQIASEVFLTTGCVSCSCTGSASRHSTSSHSRHTQHWTSLKRNKDTVQQRIFFISAVRCKSQLYSRLVLKFLEPNIQVPEGNTQNEEKYLISSLENHSSLQNKAR